MKKILFFSVLMMFFVTVCTGCIGEKISGSGNVNAEQRPVEAFDHIKIYGVFNVYLSQGDTESVTVEIDDNLQQYVNVRNDGSKLMLGIKDNFRKTTKNNIYITLKDIRMLEIDGVADVKTQTALRCANLKLDINGVSKCKLELYCNQLEVDLDGVGNILLTGETDEFTVKKDGVGNLDAEELKAQKVSIRNSGVGNSKIYASEELSVKNIGVGSVTYSGDAKIKSLSSSGIGKTKKAD